MDALAVAALVVGFCVWHVYRADKRAEADRDALIAAFRQAQTDAFRCVRDTTEAVSQALNQVVNPPAPPKTAFDIAQELYDQGAVPSIRDNTDYSDPTDHDPFLAPARADVATVAPDAREPFGVPGLTMPTVADTSPFPPPTLERSHDRHDT